LCGISLVVDTTKHLGRTPIHAMNAATEHRGRDHTAAESVITSGAEYHLGHNRLSVIDTSEAAHQPFVSDDGRYHLIYNGELFNFRELREELEADGVSFHSTGDTEVILHLLARHGPAALDRLNGMFAFVFVDTHDDVALVARDRSGIKPLYWWHDNERIVISSELHGVLASGLMPKALDDRQINHYLRFRFARKPDTFFAGISELLEGHYLEINGGQASEPVCFVTPTDLPDPSGGSTDDILGQLEGLLVESIRRHLIADVPVGLLLSGGIDSTLLLALIHDADLAKLHTFSIVNDASDASFGTEDFHYSRRAAAQYGDYPRVEVAIEASMLDDLEDFLGNMDQPIADQAALPTFLISREARRTVTVALSGAGADEVFAGYNRHDAFDRYLRYRWALGPTAPALRAVGARLPTGSEHRFRKQMLLAQKFFAAVGDDSADTYRRMQGLGGFHSLPTAVRPWDAVPSAGADAQFGAALEQDLHQYLISDILMMNDFQSMQSTLEMRIPFLDRDLLRWVEAIPPRFLIENGRKWMLGELLRRHDGAEFVDRKKEGFNIPLGKWIGDADHAHLWSFISDSDALLFEHVDQQLAQELYRSHTSHEIDRTPELFALLTLHCWLEQNFSSP
jgi:asparagine synthase (glutamine-hydrolysing)